MTVKTIYRKEINMKKNVIARISNRHMHMTEETLCKLFGENYELSVKKNLDPPIFAANETVTIEGPKGKIEGVRILGPVRQYNQVEILRSDKFKLGIDAPIKISGSKNLAPLKVTGPKGSIDFDSVALVPLRHIHFTEEQAKDFDVRKGQIVKVKVSTGDRKLIFDDVMIVITPGMPAPALDIDFEEANASCITADDLVEIIE